MGRRLLNTASKNNPSKTLTRIQDSHLMRPRISFMPLPLSTVVVPQVF